MKNYLFNILVGITKLVFRARRLDIGDMECQPPDGPMLKIFPDAVSLLHAFPVNRYWNRVENDPLWRNLCLKNQGFFVFSQCLGSQTWKQSFLTQTKQGYWVALAQEEDYPHRSNGNLMLLGPMASLSGNRHIKGVERSVACRVSSKHVLDACGMWEGKPITTPLRTLEQPSGQSP